MAGLFSSDLAGGAVRFTGLSARTVDMSGSFPNSLSLSLGSETPLELAMPLLTFGWDADWWLSFAASPLEVATLVLAPSTSAPTYTVLLA